MFDTRIAPLLRSSRNPANIRNPLCRTQSVRLASCSCSFGIQIQPAFHASMAAGCTLIPCIVTSKNDRP